MNDELREILLEEMGLGWCPIVNEYFEKENKQNDN